MKKLYSVIFGKYKKFEKTFHIIHHNIIYLKKTLVLSIISGKCKNEEEKLFKEEDPFEILKILGLIENI